MVWFFNKQYEDTKPILGRWLGVSHRVVSTICHWILNEIGNVISCATVKNLPGDKPRDSTIQEQICDYYGFLESALRNDNSGNSLERYDAFINAVKKSVAEGDPKNEDCQGPRYSP